MIDKIWGGRFTFLFACVLDYLSGTPIPAQLSWMCTYVYSPKSAGERFQITPVWKPRVVGKHRDGHTTASPPALSLIYQPHTSEQRHTGKHQQGSQGNEAERSKSALFICGTHLWLAFRDVSANGHDTFPSNNASMFNQNSGVELRVPASVQTRSVPLHNCLWRFTSSAIGTLVLLASHFVLLDYCEIHPNFLCWVGHYLVFPILFPIFSD